MAVERQRPQALTAGLQVTGRHPRRNLQPELIPGLRAASPALMAGLCLTGRQGQFHPKSSKNHEYTSSQALGEPPTESLTLSRKISTIAT